MGLFASIREILIKIMEFKKKKITLNIIKIKKIENASIFLSHIIKYISGFVPDIVQTKKIKNISLSALNIN